MKNDSMDYYIQSAEMYDILSDSHWNLREPSFVDTIKLINISEGNWINVGAGTGQELSIIAKTLPDVHLFAIEPSPSMRIGLMTRLMMLPEIQDRVTVIADSFQNATLPDSFSVATICGCIGYFDAQDRAKLWHRLANGLCDGGVVLADTMRVEQPQHVEEMKIASKTIGNLVYEIFLQGEHLNKETIRWDMRFKVIQDHHVLREFNIQRDWYAFGIQQVIDEASKEGFIPQIVNSSTVPMVILRLG